MATTSSCSSTPTRCSARSSRQLANALSPTGSTSTKIRSDPSTRSPCGWSGEKTNLPLATGEQLSHKWEFQPLIEEELVDYLRIDVAHAGGITEAKKILAAGEIHGQRSALHHASSPINGVACLHIDCAIPNFGIQEWIELESLYELFPNAPRAEDGYVTRRGARSRSRVRRGRGAQAAVERRRAPASLLARRQRRRLLQARCET